MHLRRTTRASLFSPLQRSIRIHGVSTCLRIEKIYWDILSNLARREKTPLSTMLSDWDIQARTNHDEIKNFSAYVRVRCVAHLLQQMQTENIAL
ncbi:arylsulfate sulfotransferase-like protein [Herbaspirillum sp. YR522]|nr:arylsulfate sulfotransferase-like protein [Herbaspirillum sp. YR522]